jgi:hypothetical protein
MDTTALADEPAGATDAPPRWSELIASRLGHGTAAVADAVVADVVAEAGTAVEDPTTAESPTQVADATDAETAERGGPSGSESLALDRWWVLVAPLAGAVVLSAASWLFDPNPLRTGTSPSGLLAFAVLIPYFLLCTAGTLTVIRDATRLREAGADWSPNPWRYVVPSAVALAVIRAFSVVRGVERIEESVGFLAGSLVVALVASSILAGPAYLLQRRRRLGRDQSGGARSADD